MADPTIPVFDGDGRVNAEAEILLSQDAAEQLEWEVGEVRAGAVPTRLSGTYQVNDETDSHWAHSDYATELSVLDDLDKGLLANAAAYLAPGNPGVTEPGDARLLNAWYPLNASSIAGDDVATLTAQLSGFTAGSVPLVAADSADAVAVEEPVNFEAQFSTELFNTLEALSGQQRATASIAAVVAAGPIESPSLSLLWAPNSS
ncbi:hypothetical protein [Ornithinimicrobium sp. INDO-MA30-4]|uniref:hypothetical protein n=1 Tax=Ornithinimicrobium sp. INDO-MA30-4 TaxID=2908651 RepID=UPI001F33EED5|nr:hypothetical protein [Ornithinimicrobium sp. INDO-MA30-4]UJH69686.1 hypothetical protein L0A91_10175 [Ornithinimicrobium sp. INDO-MA30-4]